MNNLPLRSLTALTDDEKQRKVVMSRAAATTMMSLRQYC